MHTACIKKVVKRDPCLRNNDTLLPRLHLRNVFHRKLGLVGL